MNLIFDILINSAAPSRKVMPILRTGVATSFLLFAGQSFASDALVSPEWLQNHYADKNVVILDLQPASGYERVHVVGAVNTDFNKWRQPKPKKGMSLPDVRYLNELIGSLGVSPNTHVVLAPIGVNANEMAIATRIYWTFKVLGHEDISILDGGLIAYSELPAPKWSEEPKKPTRQAYEAKADLTLAPQAAEVFDEWKKGTSFVDYRSEDEFYGRVGSTRPGTIPNSKNLPFDTLVEPIQGGQFLPISELKQQYEDKTIPMTGEQIAFCNSGHRASLGWFVSHELLGNKDVRLYDGSMAEWAQYPDYPVTIPK